MMKLIVEGETEPRIVLGFHPTKGFFDEPVLDGPQDDKILKIKMKKIKTELGTITIYETRRVYAKFKVVNKQTGEVMYECQPEVELEE